MNEDVTSLVESLWNFRNDPQETFVAMANFKIRTMMQDVRKPYGALIEGRDRAMGALLDHLEGLELLPTLIGLDPLLDEFIKQRMKR